MIQFRVLDQQRNMTYPKMPLSFIGTRSAKPT